MSKDIINTRHK